MELKTQALRKVARLIPGNKELLSKYLKSIATNNTPDQIADALIAVMNDPDSLYEFIGLLDGIVTELRARAEDPR